MGKGKSVGGYKIKKDDSLSNEDPKRESLTREAGFSFPLATAGWFVAGPIGVAGGHILGAIGGYIRHKRIKKE